MTYHFADIYDVYNAFLVYKDMALLYTLCKKETLYIAQRMLYVHFRQEKVKFCNIMAKLCQNRRHNFRHNVGKFDIFCLEMYSQHSFRNVTVTFSPII